MAAKPAGTEYFFSTNIPTHFDFIRSTQRTHFSKFKPFVKYVYKNRFMQSFRIEYQTNLYLVVLVYKEALLLKKGFNVPVSWKGIIREITTTLSREKCPPPQKKKLGVEFNPPPPQLPPRSLNGQSRQYQNKLISFEQQINR